MVEHIKRDLATVPPSGAVAGAYAFVDGSRGVWKAPANVSLSAVRGPMIPIDHFDQEDLNGAFFYFFDIHFTFAYSALWPVKTQLRP